MWHQPGATAREEDVETVVALAREAEPRCGATIVVAIDGPSASGKTTLATGVASALTTVDTVEVVHLDLIYPGWDGLAAAPALLAGQVLRPIAEGHPAAYRLWSWVHDEWRGERAVPPSRFLVVEGCGCSAEPARAYAAVRVFVEADGDLRMRRGMARDGETYRPHWERWAAQETRLFAADHTRERADLIIDTSSL